MARISKLVAKKIARKRNKFKIFGLVLLIFLLLFLGGVVFKSYRSVTHGLWDGQSQFNLVLNPSDAKQPVLIFGFNHSENSLNVLLIEPGTYIETIHGYGSSRVESIYRLGELDKKGGELFSGSLEEYLGLPVDAFAAELKPPLPDIQKTGFLGKLFGSLLKGKGKTNLTSWDLWRLWWNFKNLRQDKIILISLNQTSASQEIDLLDGTKASKIDPQRLESIISQFFIDQRLKDEDLTLTVLNGTSHLGLANKMATLVKNIGGQVISVGETEDIKSQISNLKCQIRSEKKFKNTYTFKKLTKIFGCQWQEGRLTDQRADMALIAGEGYWEKLALP